MHLSQKYLDQEEYERDWEPRYQSLEEKYYRDDGTQLGDPTDYNSDLERLDYQYAKMVSERIHQRIKEALLDCQSSLEENDYNLFEKKYNELSQRWQDFNTSFHYKMSARGILERD